MSISLRIGGAWVAATRRVRIGGAWLPEVAPPAPGMFGYLAWDIDPNGNIIVTTLPSGTITHLDIEIAGGSPVALSSATPGTYASAATPGQSVRIRARNGSTPGDWSLAQFVPVWVDRFNRANQALQASSNWAQAVAGALVVASNRVENTNDTVRQAWVTAAAANLANVRVEADILAMGNHSGQGASMNIIMRHPVGGNTNGDAVQVQFTAFLENILIQTRVGTTTATRETVPTGAYPAAPYRVAAECVGDTVRAFINGVQFGPDVTQTAFTAAGRPGMRPFRPGGSAQNIIQIDNFRVIPR